MDHDHEKDKARREISPGFFEFYQIEANDD